MTQIRAHAHLGKYRTWLRARSYRQYPTKANPSRISDLDKQNVQREAQRRGTNLGQPTQYSEAVNRYLAAAGYSPVEQIRKAPAAVPPAASPDVKTGVVMVAVDETPTSYTAVDHAAIEAELRGWDMRIVHVQRPGGRHPTARDSDWAAAVVVGRRGSGGRPVALLGSVSRSLVQHAYCPVFLVD